LKDPLHDGPDDESLDGFFEEEEDGLLLAICPPGFVALDFPLLDAIGLESDTRRLARSSPVVAVAGFVFVVGVVVDRQ